MMRGIGGKWRMRGWNRTEARDETFETFLSFSTVCARVVGGSGFPGGLRLKTVCDGKHCGPHEGAP